MKIAIGIPFATYWRNANKMASTTGSQQSRGQSVGHQGD
jgi:hypothetical protein